MWVGLMNLEKNYIWDHTSALGKLTWLSDGAVYDTKVRYTDKVEYNERRMCTRTFSDWYSGFGFYDRGCSTPYKFACQFSCHSPGKYLLHCISYTTRLISPFSDIPPPQFCLSKPQPMPHSQNNYVAEDLYGQAPLPSNVR